MANPCKRGKIFLSAAARRAAIVGLVMTMSSSAASHTPAVEPGPLLIAHRGASGHLPEHTLAAYFVAIENGADFVEPDLVMTRDGVLVARHENAIAVFDRETGRLVEATTDVAERPGFAGRRTTKRIDGADITGWFTEDFTLAELKTLRARERLPQLRPGNARFDGMFEVPTLDEVLQLVAAANGRRAAAAKVRSQRPPPPIGVYPETKHPSYFAGIGLGMEAPLVATLRRHGYRGPRAPVFIQSFEVGNLRRLARLTRLPLVQLMDAEGRPYDFAVSGDPRTYADLATSAGLRDVARYASAIGVSKNMLIPRTADGLLGVPSSLVKDAHAAGLAVHAWTFRAENRFLPADFRRGDDPAAIGDMAGELRRYLELGIDGFFTDHPAIAGAVR